MVREPQEIATRATANLKPTEGSVSPKSPPEILGHFDRAVNPRETRTGAKYKNYRNFGPAKSCPV